MAMDGRDGMAADGSGGPLDDAQHTDERTVSTTIGRRFATGQ